MVVMVVLVLVIVIVIVVMVVVMVVIVVVGGTLTLFQESIERGSGRVVIIQEDYHQGQMWGRYGLSCYFFLLSLEGYCHSTMRKN